MKRALKGNQILSEIDFHNPFKKNTDTHIQRAREWAENIIKRSLKKASEPSDYTSS